MGPLAISAAAAAVALALLAPRASAQQRPPPVWPAAFSVNFSETTSDIISSFNTTGAWYYDWASARQRIDRASGKDDRFCGSVDSVDAPCSHLVRGGERYLVWPTLRKCCGCCNETQGCGVVKPTWMRDAGGAWAGTAPLTTPVWKGSADSWEITGNQPNYWFTIAGQDVPVGFAQVPDDYQYFDPATYYVGPQEDSLFALPDYCTPTCAGVNVCTLL